ncbi:flagellin [Aequitasia blattaphilus]|uniref:Flagellin n=1 Tax=Aequitasia blattaphilus TaxID=2949332 RepID=A0ABT1E9X8_9FIRM|nr:flagellin [Aequitasia blattaphilus]MCP1102491.1 flagellin [Aequitasia blattaphilus]MCR8615131.1 flagellin [Aequitasia blattaphilus]
MRIQHNITAINSYRNLTNNNSAVGKNLEKLSSGYRINRAGDDAAGLAISEKMRAQITGLETAGKNAQDAVSLIQTAEGSLTEVHSMMNRMVELATQSANGIYDDAANGGVDRVAMQAEIDSLNEEINRIAESTNFNGTKLLDGSFADTQFQIGDSKDDILNVSIADMSASGLGLSGLDITDVTKANEAIDTIKTAINTVSTQRGSLGAYQNRLEHTINNLSVNAENMTAAESRIRDVDMAKEMMAYTKNNILVQSSQAMLAQANSIPQGVLQLLQ